MTLAHLVLWSGCCLLTATLTWLAIAYAKKVGLMDLPGERRSHKQATPRGGGISIVVTMVLVSILIFLQGRFAAAELFLILAGLGLVAVPGWVDDHRSLPAWPRLFAHALSAACIALLIWRMNASVTHAVLTFLMTIALVNIWNFMDGINGLAVSQAAIVAAGFAIFLWPSSWALLAVCLMAATLGFIPFNFPQARIFLGDVGSCSLGFLIALFAALILLMPEKKPATVVLPLLAFGVDAGLTLLRRMTAGERWWTPHATHAYQCLARRFGQSSVTTMYGLFTACAVLVSLWLSKSSSPISMLLVLLLTGGAVVVWWKVAQHRA